MVKLTGYNRRPGIAQLNRAGAVKRLFGHKVEADIPKARALLQQQLGFAATGIAVQTDMAMPPIHKFGSEEIKQKYLRGAIAGSRVTMEATLATELSGFGLAADMSDTLVEAISQSGTTTDTSSNEKAGAGTTGSLPAFPVARGHLVGWRT